MTMITAIPHKHIAAIHRWSHLTVHCIESPRLSRVPHVDRMWLHPSLYQTSSRSIRRWQRCFIASHSSGYILLHICSPINGFLQKHCLPEKKHMIHARAHMKPASPESSKHTRIDYQFRRIATSGKRIFLNGEKMTFGCNGTHQLARNRPA